MRLGTVPVLRWLDVEFVCGTCGGGVFFEVTDLGGRIKKPPRQISGVWSVQVQCPWCGRVGEMREITEDA